MAHAVTVLISSKIAISLEFIYGDLYLNIVKNFSGIADK